MTASAFASASIWLALSGCGFGPVGLDGGHCGAAMDEEIAESGTGTIGLEEDHTVAGMERQFGGDADRTGVPGLEVCAEAEMGEFGSGAIARHGQLPGGERTGVPSGRCQGHGKCANRVSAGEHQPAGGERDLIENGAGRIEGNADQGGDGDRGPPGAKRGGAGIGDGTRGGDDDAAPGKRSGSEPGKRFVQPDGFANDEKGRGTERRRLPGDGCERPGGDLLLRRGGRLDDGGRSHG